MMHVNIKAALFIFEGFLCILHQKLCQFPAISGDLNAWKFYHHFFVNGILDFRSLWCGVDWLTRLLTLWC
jgi:hypothetical protein